jgi:hypothetical protein
MEHPKGKKFLVREKPPPGQRGVEDGTGMTFRKYKTIPVFPLRLLRSEPQYSKIKRGYHVCCGHTRTRMTVPNPIDHFYHIMTKRIAHDI